MHNVKVGDKVLIQPDWTNLDEETKQVRLQLACGTDLSFAEAQAMNTPLWFAEVTNASDKDVVNVAWYLSFANREPEPRMDGKWSLVCKCQPFHKYDKSVCMKRRNHGLWVDTVSPRPLYNPSAAADSCCARAGRSRINQGRRCVFDPGRKIVRCTLP